MSKFIPWVSDGNVVENTNVYNYENFSGINSQSKEGFQSGNIISSTYMNSALRQANLVIAALMECTGNNTLDLTSSVTDVKSALQTYFSGLNVARATSDSDGTNIKANYAKQNGTYNNMTVGNATNATNATYAKSDSNANSIDSRLNRLEVLNTTSVTGAADIYNHIINVVNAHGTNYAKKCFEKILIFISSNVLKYTEKKFTIYASSTAPSYSSSEIVVNNLIPPILNSPLMYGDFCINHETLNDFIITNYVMEMGVLYTVRYYFYGTNRGVSNTSHTFSSLTIDIICDAIGQSSSGTPLTHKENYLRITSSTSTSDYSINANISYIK